MPFRDNPPIHKTVKEIRQDRDSLTSLQLLWADVDGHVAASHVAESLGDKPLVAKHLQTVTRLLIEIHSVPAA